MREKPQRVKKVWGEEVWLANEKERNYCSKKLIIKRGYKCSYHCHPVKDETFYLESGLVWFKLKDKVMFLRPEDKVHIPSGTYHTFFGLTDSVILETSTYHDDNDVQRKVKSTKLKKDPWEYLFEKKKILVIGDVMVDEYIEGDVTRISPEAPVPVLHIKNRYFKPGGAANVAVNLAALNQEVHLIGKFGYGGLKLRGLLKDIYFNFIRDKSITTTRKTRIIGGRQHIVRIDEENNNPISGRLWKKIKLPTKVDAVVFSDYNKGMLVPELVKQVIKRYKNVPILVDPKNVVDKYKGCTVLMPNKKELIDLSKNPTIEAACMVLARKLKCKYVTPTMGKGGMFIYDTTKHHYDEQTTHIPTYSNEIALDVSGLGDTVSSILTAGLATGFDIYECAKMAMYGTDIAMRTMGVYAVKSKEFKDYN